LVETLGNDKPLHAGWRTFSSLQEPTELCAHGGVGRVGPHVVEINRDEGAIRWNFAVQSFAELCPCLGQLAVVSDPLPNRSLDARPETLLHFDMTGKRGW